jgi:sugar (pentulose or hexulose) kinase
MQEVSAIFDVGKTNKKLFLFDNAGHVVQEYSETLPETSDEDGFPCEDIHLLKKWIMTKWDEVISNRDYHISHLNFTAYGASFVHLDKSNEPATPLYFYMKPYPAEIAEELYSRYGGKWNFSAVTSSPPMSMLNSGLQLLWMKYRKQELFEKIAVSLHLPQYLSFLFSSKKLSEYTSIGCHTALWNFADQDYHQWVSDEKIDKLLAPLNTNPMVDKLLLNGQKILVGPGLHDSSSALLPYLRNIKTPFLLISSGTWCITFNPFNSSTLTNKELALDCLCYLTTEGKPVKASRIFLGKEHEFQSARIEKHFEKNKGYCNDIKFDDEEIRNLLIENRSERRLIPVCMEGTGPYPAKTLKEWNLEQFSSCEEAYLQLLTDLTCMLRYAVELVESSKTETLFVEGGFADNEIFMNLLANHFPGKEVKSSYLKQATALGALLQVNASSKLKDWKFRSFKASDLKIPLENYYRHNWKLVAN